MLQKCANQVIENQVLTNTLCFGIFGDSG